jgi:hypothetical protein
LDTRAVAKEFKDFEWMRKNPNLESIREDPRFRSLGGRAEGVSLENGVVGPGKPVLPGGKLGEFRRP